MQSYEILLQRIEEYKKRYFLNQFVKGSLFFFAILGTMYLLVNTAEFIGRFSSTGRTILVFSFILTTLASLFFFVVRPLLSLYGLRKSLTDDEAAQQIGQFFPEVGDKLLNTLQLRRISIHESDLLQASLQQRSQQLLINRFANAIQLDKNRQFLKYAIPPLALILFIFLVNPTFFANPSKRLVNYNREFAEEAPFRFIIQNKSLKAFRNEDFPVTVKLEGDALPQSVYLVTNGTRFKLEPSNGLYHYTFDNVQRDLDFHLEASGFNSSEYSISLIDRPAVLNFDVRLTYPAYLNKPAEQLSNVGNLLVPQGTIVDWNFTADHTDSLSLRFNNESSLLWAKPTEDNEFNITRRVMQNSLYTVSLKNKEVLTPSTIQYNIQVIPDRFPTISVDRIQDTVTYNYIALSGLISDDYGFTKLKLNYRVQHEGKFSPMYTRDISFNRTTTSQNFSYNWYLDSLKLGQEDRLEYFVQVWDNDGVSGPKSSRSNPLNFSIPSNSEVQKQIDESAKKTEQQIDDALSKTQNIKKELNQMEDRLRTKKTSDFQDKKQLSDVLQKREDLLKQIQQLQEQFQKTNDTQQRFNQNDQKLQEKMQQLQNLFKDLLDPESKKLYEELKQLLERKQDDKASEMLDRLSRKERSMERDLERALKLFKQMQLEQKLSNTLDELEKQAERQEKEAQENNKDNQANKDNKKAQDQKDNKKPDAKDKDSKDGKENDSKSKDKDSKDGKENDSKNKDKDSKDGKENSKENDANNDNKDGGDDIEQQKKDQEKAIEDFKKLQEQLKELEKQAEKDQLKMPDKQEDTQQDIQQEMQDSQQQLNQKKSKNASSSQSKTAKSMRKMKQQMQEAMESGEMEEMQENIDDLRAILENLITLSFSQERIMKDFRGMNLQDPRVSKLSQEQLKLQDDAKIIEDSLNALASRVVQIQSFVTREVSGMKYYMDESVQQLRERRLSQAASRQQFAMTSMNNLALMLSDALKNMQQQMNAMAMPGQSGKGKKGQKPDGNMGEMQKQLNGKMQKMQQGGQSGRALSEELSRLAAEQAMIRNMLRQLQEKAKGTEVGKQMEKQVNDLMEKMDETETDLVNKRVNQNTINRQNEIMVRLLESEKALKQQEEDPKRQAETAKSTKQSTPPFFDSLSNKQQVKQVEVLRSVTPNYNSFYKKEANQYLQKVSK